MAGGGLYIVCTKNTADKKVASGVIGQASRNLAVIGAIGNFGKVAVRTDYPADISKDIITAAYTDCDISIIIDIMYTCSVISYSAQNTDADIYTFDRLDSFII